MDLVPVDACDDSEVGVIGRVVQSGQQALATPGSVACDTVAYFSRDLTSSSRCTRPILTRFSGGAVGQSKLSGYQSRLAVVIRPQGPFLFRPESGRLSCCKKSWWHTVREVAESCNIPLNAGEA